MLPRSSAVSLATVLASASVLPAATADAHEMTANRAPQAECAADAHRPLQLSRLKPVGMEVAEPVPATRVDAWSAEESELCRRYRSPAAEDALARLRRLREELGRASESAKRSIERRIAELERTVRVACLRELVTQAFPTDGATPRQHGDDSARREAVDLITRMRHPAELADALGVLRGDVPQAEGRRRDLVMTESDVRNSLFAALAADPKVGQVKLVELGVTAGVDLSAAARDALPRTLSPEALDALRVALASPRELFLNRAAMIAGAHPAGSLIPSLIQAQFEETDPPETGDEAWIAIGKSTAYVAGLVPVVGNASGAFQPIPGVLYEGSVLRIMESAVTVYRTEVHSALLATIEATTGQPAPPLGYDRDRWLAWHRDDYPRLAHAHLRESQERAAAEGVRTAAPRDDT